MKKIFKMLPLVGGLVSCSNSQAIDAPNIIYVFPDQLRNCAMSYWDEEPFSQFQGWKADPTHTPNLNNFARESMVLSRATSTCPLSSPYRGMFLTGMFPHNSGIISNCMALRPTNGLRTDATTISDVLSNSGYSCGYIGKYHADAPTKNDPDNPGHYVEERVPAWDAYTPAEKRHNFDYWYSYGTFDEHKNPHYWDNDGVKHSPKEFSVKHEVDMAIKYLKNTDGQRDAKKPFFLCVGMNPPHSPYENLDNCMEEDFNLYKDMSVDELLVRDNADRSMDKARSAAYYFANVTAVDREFGRLMKELKKMNLDKNTIVIFTADHGETMCSHGVNDAKNSLWTEAFTVPFMIRYPEKLRPRVDTTLLATTDIMPTLLSLVDLKDAIPEEVQGRDLSPIFTESVQGEEYDAIAPKAALYLKNVNGEKDENGYVKSFFPIARGVKTAEYSMEIVINKDYKVKKVSIFNDRLDPYQMNNLYTKKTKNNPEIQSLYKELLSMLKDELKRSDDIWYREHIISNID